MAGTLYLCATPIGNLADMSLRALSLLTYVNVIAAEDTRQTLKLLNHYAITTPLFSYHEHNKMEKTPLLVQRMLDGEDVALVTDAGTPAISDPGEDLVRACHEAGITVTSLPGPSALITALTQSGMSTRRFVFEGFLPRTKKERAVVLEHLSVSTYTTIFYEAPHRLAKTLELLEGAVGSERPIAVCRELTKIHEEVRRFTMGEAVAYYGENQPKGEFVLVLAGADSEKLLQEEQLEWQEIPIGRHMEMYMEKGMDKKDAMKAVAKDRGMTKRAVYAALLER